MAGIIVFATYLAAGCLIMHVALPDKSPLIRVWIGLSLGVLMMMWLPALAAFIIDFTLTAEYIALGALLLVTGCAAIFRFKHPVPVKGLEDSDRGMLLAQLCFTLPLTVLTAYLQHTHTIREVDGAMHVGQSTYGDMCMHLSIITSLRNALLPTEYNFLPGTAMGYPILTDGMSTSMYLLDTPLRLTIIIPGTVMSALVYAGFLLLAREMTGKTSTAVIAGVLLFLNGGLGFLYDFDMAAQDRSRIAEIFTGYYATPANQPDYNLRWSNLIVDMLLPQRTFLGGWVLLLPALYFAREAFKRKEMRMFLLVALFGAAMPMVHTHSFLALALYSAAALAYAYASQREGRKKLVTGAAVYLGIVLALALPQLVASTLKQATSEGFIRPYFNWVNNNGSGLIDFYPWFWLKNVGLQLVVMVFALLDMRRRHRMDLLGASLIFIVAETILFQPLAYDNNKLFYVWYLLMLPAAADWCLDLWHKLRGQRSRVLLAALFFSAATISGALSVCREVVSDYQLFSAADVKAAAYVEENTEPDALFMTGMNHNNPIYTLTGRRIVCGPSNFLWTHGLSYQENANDVRRFYAYPEENLDVLKAYGVEYIYLGWTERQELGADEEVLDRLFTVIYDVGGIKIYEAETKGIPTAGASIRR